MGEEQDRALLEERMAVPRDKAAVISGLSLRQIDYWAKTGLIVPAVDTKISPGRRVRLYGFVDLLALIMAARLRTDYHISLQHIRQIVQHLKARGYETPLTQLTFAVMGKNVYFQHPDGQWEGDLRPDQVVLQQVLDLRPLRQRIHDSVRRHGEQVGKVEKRVGTLGSKTIFAGTRVPVDTIRRYLAAGKSINEILEAFPGLTRKDVRAASQIDVA